MAQTDRPRPFRYDADVPPGKKRQFRYPVSETYLGDSVGIPVTVINGDHAGPPTPAEVPPPPLS